MNCGYINEEPVKKRIENTEPISFTPEAAETAEPVSVVPEETVEEVIEETAEEAAAEEVKETEEVLKSFLEEPVPDEAEEDEDGGTEELPFITEDEDDSHMTNMLADTNSHAYNMEDSGIDIPVFNNFGSTKTEVLTATPIDNDEPTRLYAKPEPPAAAEESTKGVEPIEEEPDDDEEEYEDDEYDDDEYDDEEYYEDEIEETSSTEKLIIILAVLLALVIGAFAYIWIMRPDLLKRSSGKENTETSAEVVSSEESSEESESSVSSETEGSEETSSEEVVPLAPETDGYSINLTDPVASVDSSLTSGDPVHVGDVTGEVIGYANIEMETLLVFSDHSTSSECLGHARYGAHYEVDAVYEDGEYTWYEIAEGMWVPDSNGQWITYEEN